MSASDRAERVAEVVEAAMERAPADRGRFVDEVCAGDTALRSEVESLLKFSGEAAAFIEEPAIHATAESFVESEEDGLLTAGETIGEYEILSLIGAGGMGEVYLAADRSLGRRVALKTVKGTFGGRDLLRHFRQEERILAGLTHPNIARLYGGGLMANGVPYFVMEYVEGERVDVYCDTLQLGIDGRLQLFRQICAAVAYAHQRLIIHRDLKPANIRVTQEGEPKLLDFGIAKLLDAEGSAAGEQTMTLLGMMTPEYASPEQVRGEMMTTASDVYSLGVILYELLSGEKPYRITSRRPGEIARAITDTVPARPSTAPRAESTRNMDVRKALRGDLDNIVLMAMRKEPERRYASVALLAEDIRRHLEGLPVIARKDTAGYRASKFIRRHRAGVVAAALVALTLVGGIAATARQTQIARRERSRAEQRFNDVRKLANSVVFELHDAIENLPGSTAARELLVRRALEYLDSLARESSDDASLQRELAAAYLKIGSVQGNPTNPNLGDSAGALQSYRHALAINEKLVEQSNDVEARRALAFTLRKMADVEANSSDVVHAVETARRSVSLFRELAEAAPSNFDTRLDLAISYVKTADILGNPNFENVGDAKGGIENYGAALNILTALQAENASHPKTRRYLGIIHERIGAMRELQNDGSAAVEEYKTSAAIRVPLAEEFPNDTTIVRDAAIAYEKLGNAAAAAGDLGAALDDRRRSLEIFERLLAVDPQNAQARQSLAISHIHLADLLGGGDANGLSRAAEARDHYQRAAELLEAVTHADPTNVGPKKILAEVRASIDKLPAAPR